MNIQESDIRRFERRVRRTDGCWLWTGSQFGNGKGYGKFWCSGTHMNAHRFAYILVRGHIPAGLCVCHHCDNPSCVRPDHLFVGSIADNNHDMQAKGRANYFGNHPSRSGEMNGRARLTGEQAKLIMNSGEPNADLGRRFGISRDYVGKLKKGLRWKALDMQ